MGQRTIRLAILHRVDRLPHVVTLPQWRQVVTPDEREKMAILCERIAKERDPQKFDKFVQQLMDLLELKHERIHPEHKMKLY